MGEAFREINDGWGSKDIGMFAKKRFQEVPEMFWITSVGTGLYYMDPFFSLGVS